MISNLQRVDRAIARIKRGWTQGSFAEDSNGIPVDQDSAKAVCWCLAGSLGWGSGLMLSSMLRKIVDDKSIGAWNDEPGRTRADVLAMLRKLRRWVVAQNAKRAGSKSK